MTRRTVPVLLWSLMVLAAGCVDEDVPAPGPGVAGDAEALEEETPGEDVGSVAESERTVRSTPFTLEGETPASVGLCGIPDPVGPCASHVLDAGDYVLAIPHDGNVTGISFTFSFEPVAPTVTGLFHMVHVDDGMTETMVSGGVLSSGDEVILEGLEVNATATITFFAWPPGTETPLGWAWVDPVNQPFVVEGTMTTYQTAV